MLNATLITLHVNTFMLHVDVTGCTPEEKQESDDDAHDLYFKEIMTKFVHRNILTVSILTLINKTKVIS